MKKLVQDEVDYIYTVTLHWTKPSVQSSLEEFEAHARSGEGPMAGLLEGLGQIGLTGGETTLRVEAHLERVEMRGKAAEVEVDDVPSKG